MRARASVRPPKTSRLVEIIEKPDDPPSTLATTGCYVCSEELFDALELCRPSARGEYELSDAVGVLVRAGADVIAHPLETRRVNVNKPDDIKRAAELVDVER